MVLLLVKNRLHLLHALLVWVINIHCFPGDRAPKSLQVQLLVQMWLNWNSIALFGKSSAWNELDHAGRSLNYSPCKCFPSYISPANLQSQWTFWVGLACAGWDSLTFPATLGSEHCNFSLISQLRIGRQSWRFNYTCNTINESHQKEIPKSMRCINL